MLESGFKISDLNSIPITDKDSLEKNKIALDKTYFLTYANSLYGIKYNTHNYKVPLSSLRDDIRSYIGINNINTPWTGQINLWGGSWNNTADPNLSYVKVWTSEEAGNILYNPDKFKNLNDNFYIIKDAPFPFESGEKHNRGAGDQGGEIIPPEDGSNPTGTDENGEPIYINLPIAAADPYPDSNKIVTKKYIDERLAAKRLVEVGKTFRLRDYDCTYLIRANELIDGGTIKIIYTKEFFERTKHNSVEFSLLLEGKQHDGVWYPANGTNPINWNIVDENNNPINFSFLESTEANYQPDLCLNKWYKNSRYVFLKFKTSTSEIVLTGKKTTQIDGVQDENNNPILVDSYNEYSTKFDVFITCENALYRGSNSIDIIGTSPINVVSAGSTYSLSLKKGLIRGGSLIAVNENAAGDQYEISFEGIIPSVAAGNLVTVSSNDGQYTVGLKDNIVKGGNLISSSYNSTNGYTVAFTGIIPTVKAALGSLITVTPSADKSVYTIGFKGISPDIPSITVSDPLEITFNDNNYNISIDQTALAKAEVRGSSTITVTSSTSNNVTTYTASANLDNIQKITLDNSSSIDLSAYNKSYYISGGSKTLIFSNSIPDKSVKTIKIYYNCTSNNSTINGVNWSMTTDNNAASPNFISGRLYCIELTCLPANYGTTSSQQIARIAWFTTL